MVPIDYNQRFFRAILRLCSKAAGSMRFAESRVSSREKASLFMTEMLLLTEAPHITPDGTDLSLSAYCVHALQILRAMAALVLTCQGLRSFPTTTWQLWKPNWRAIQTLLLSWWSQYRSAQHATILASAFLFRIESWLAAVQLLAIVSIDQNQWPFVLTLLLLLLHQ